MNTQVNNGQRDGASRNSHGRRFTRFCFTVHGTPVQLEYELRCLKTLTPKWLIVGRETCPETKRIHLQGACVLGKQVAFTTIKNMPGLTRAHIEPMGGTPEQNRTYCTKEDNDPYEYGEMPMQGKRNDLIACVDLLKAGHTIKDLVRDSDSPIVATFVRYPKGLTTVSHILREEVERTRPFVMWLHGATGTGKTRSAYQLAELLGFGDDVWASNAGLQWFDGYAGHRVAILDDYRTSDAKFSFILRLLDRYKFDVPYKGGFVAWQPWLIVVTTPKSARRTWDLRTEEDLKQLERRIQVSIDSDGHEDSYDVFFRCLLKSLRDTVAKSNDFPTLAGLLADIPPEDPEGSKGDCSISGTDDAFLQGLLSDSGLCAPSPGTSASPILASSSSSSEEEGIL